LFLLCTEKQRPALIVKNTFFKATLIEGAVVFTFHLIFSSKITKAWFMKKVLFFVLFFAMVVVFEFCNSSKKLHKSLPSTTYAANVQNIVAGNCSPCHVGDGARVKRLDSYDAVKANIDDIIHRVQLNPNDKGFMPMRHPKLPDSTIQVFVNWKDAGMPQ
jgi:hypothetical protein